MIQKELGHGDGENTAPRGNAAPIAGGPGDKNPIDSFPHGFLLPGGYPSVLMKRAAQK